MRKSFVMGFLALLLAFSAFSCGKATINNPTTKEETKLANQNYAFPVPTEPQGANPIATITLADGSVIKAELYPGKAPNTVNNFISLVNAGFYSGKVFHRAVAGFMIQGGSPTGNGTSAGFSYAIPGEFPGNNFTQNDLKHERGVLSMARMGVDNYQGTGKGYNTGSCQFFIMHAQYPSLDNLYAPFGKVIAGLDVVDKIATSPVTGSYNDQLITPVVIKSITVDTQGLTYPEPITVAAPK